MRRTAAPSARREGKSPKISTSRDRTNGPLVLSKSSMHAGISSPERRSHDMSYNKIEHVGYPEATVRRWGSHVALSGRDLCLPYRQRYCPVGRRDEIVWVAFHCNRPPRMHILNAVPPSLQCSGVWYPSSPMSAVTSELASRPSYPPLATVTHVEGSWT